MRLHVGDLGYGNSRGGLERMLHIGGTGLLDEELDKGARIEEEDQRRPSLT